MMSLVLCTLALTPTQTPATKDIAIVAKQGTGTPQGREAWQRLADGGPELLPALLRGMDSADIVTCNWLRTACDRVFDRHVKTVPKKINVDALLLFAADANRQGRVRRYALRLVERLRPGTIPKFVAGKWHDPEFRYDAVDQLLDKAKQLAEDGAKKSAIATYRQALEHSRDVEQGRRAVAGLLDYNIQTSLAKHLGFLTDWHVIGPFDAPNKSGFKTPYPPEKKIALTAKYKGQAHVIAWKRYLVQEASPKIRARHIALVNLREQRALGDADDAVAFAYTEIAVAKDVQVEFRGAADDNFIVWVNRQRVFGFEEYQNGIRHDRHRFPVRLRKGKNTILVKVCQSPPYLAPNWEFILRVVDKTGKGVAFHYPKRN